MQKLVLFLFLFIHYPLLWGQEEVKWLPRDNQIHSKGRPIISPGHTGTAGIIKNDGAELSLFNPSRIGMTENTELLFRIGEECILPNIGIKHRWWKNDRFALSSEHYLYYTWPFLKIIQSTGIKDLIPDSVPIKQGIAMRHEILFSWPVLSFMPGKTIKRFNLSIGFIRFITLKSYKTRICIMQDCSLIRIFQNHFITV